MIQVIHGKKGSGKTKKILDMANAAIKEQKGDVIFLDDDNRYMFDLRHEVRFVNAGEYGSDSPEMFFGFLCGMLAQNFDITVIFVDAFLKLVKTDVEKTQEFFARLEKLSEKHNVDFILSVNCDDAVAPEFIQKYFI
ncbi:MAG: twitching motility protein PilT [Clostridiales bacterium]|nr:twitching motility protein PilT [Clostridiales bacterium]